MNRVLFLAASLTFTFLSLDKPVLAQARLTWLPGFNANAVSADGRVVVGSMSGQATRWTANEGFLDLGTLPGELLDFATAASYDGEVIVGRSFNETRPHAFRWTRSAGIERLPLLDGSFDMGTAWGLSGDGSIAVGVIGSDFAGQAGMWSSEGPQRLGSLSTTFPYSQANGISSDGLTIVGVTELLSDGVSGPEGFYWTADTGMVPLGNLRGSHFDSYAHSVSADGSVIVGRSTTASGNSSSGGAGTEAFYWTSDGGMIGLGDLAGGGFNSSALAVSADGSIIVGTSEIDVVPDGSFGDYRHVFSAFLWNEADGIRSVQEVLESDFGLDLTGSGFREATAISADGTVIVGNGTGPQGAGAWVVQIPIPEPSAMLLLLIGSIFPILRCILAKYRLHRGSLQP